jgi:hypothetical protein
MKEHMKHQHIKSKLNNICILFFHSDCILSLEQILWKVQLLLVETILYKYIDFRSIQGLLLA